MDVILNDVQSVLDMRLRLQAYAKLFSVKEEHVHVYVKGTFQTDDGSIVFAERHWMRVKAIRIKYFHLAIIGEMDAPCIITENQEFQMMLSME